MRTIQEVGTEILTGQPAPLYIFVGAEYGIKEKYIELIADHYNNLKVEVPSFKSLLDMMTTKRLIPLEPQLYVVRYDEELIANLDDVLAAKISSANIVGTIVCIYEQSKHVSKLCKYLDSYVVSIDAVSPTYISSYLTSEFPHLPERLITIATKIGDNYGQSRNICLGMDSVSDELSNLSSDEQIARLFGKKSDSSDSEIKSSIASKHVSQLIKLADMYPNDLDQFIYTILSTMIELDKLMDNPHASSELRCYVKLWKHADVYNMFDQAYSELCKLRTVSQNAYESVIYLITLLKFKTIPSVEALS